MASSAHSKTKVCYFYDSNIGNYYYKQDHPMKPHRIRMAHNLLLNYGLYKKMQIFRPFQVTAQDMTKFHSDKYIQFLSSINPSNLDQFTKEMEKFGVVEDCPIFDGLFEFCQLSAGGSVGGAVKLNGGDADIAINWAGGLHHAKKSEASGFCYVNDIVLAILELLKSHQRVLYVDIDVHHGDGVEEAFYTTDRVMTVSFHKYGGYFPGSGHRRDVGASRGKYYSVNVPLKSGIDDETYDAIFTPIMTKIMELYRPGAIVLQCGADSLAEDRLGCFNLTLKGHSRCVQFMKQYKLPLLLLGGGGYTLRNVARCWAYETAVAVDAEVSDKLPYNDYYEYFAPDFKLEIERSDMPNKNTPDYVDKIKTKLFENLRMLPCAPGVGMVEIPEASLYLECGESIEDGEKGKEEGRRISIMDSDNRIEKDNEFSDSEDEGEGRRDEVNFGERFKRLRLDEVVVVNEIQSITTEMDKEDGKVESGFSRGEGAASGEVDENIKNKDEKHA